MEKFEGKNAWWFLLIFGSYNVFPLFLFLMDKLSYNGWFIATWLVYYASNIIWIPIIVRNYILLYDSYFVFCYGFLKMTVYIDDIKKIEKSKSFLASSANSLDRIYIGTKNIDFCVSLKENERFIEEIKKRRTLIQGDEKHES